MTVTRELPIEELRAFAIVVRSVSENQEDFIHIKNLLGDFQMVMARYGETIWPNHASPNRQDVRTAISIAEEYNLESFSYIQRESIEEDGCLPALSFADRNRLENK